MPGRMVRQKRDAAVPEIDRPPFVRLAGRGLHTGADCALTLRPAAPGRGWRLGGVPVPTLPVIDTRLATTVLTPTGPLMTVEHLFAALAGMGVADVEIEASGPEVPALDGSAAPFCAAVRALALPRPGLPQRSLDGPVEVLSGPPGGPHASITANPSSAFALDVSSAFPVLGTGRFAGLLDDFETALAPARTFGFRRDLAALRAAGRALGADLTTCLALDDEGRPLNPGGMRFPDEPFRHKALDLLGDLGRLGFLPRALVRANAAGHRLHATLAERLLGGPSDVARS